MNQRTLLAVVATAVLATGCSTIINGHDQTMTINSNVQGADVSANGKTIGTTPFTGLVPRGTGTVVVVKKDGYQPKTVTLDTSIEPMFWGNIIIGGVLGSTTDASTGSMYKYSPTTVQVDLEPATPGK